MKIYTKTGDKGETSLFTGERVPKNSPYIDSLGCVDEANSAIGLCIANLPDIKDLTELKNQLITIQHALFDLGAALATPRSKAQANRIEKTRFDKDATGRLENWIDLMQQSLPPLKSFILPGGHPSSAALHLARSIARRTERCLVPLNQAGDVSDNVFIYMNRLSDYLFVASRWINLATKSTETLWEHHKGFASK